MLPPPAPISARSIVGVRSRYPEPRVRRVPELMPPPNSSSGAIAGAPSITTAALAVVPPMSKASTRSRPRCRASWAAASTPAVGPDSRQNAGSCAASAAGITPPLDCSIRMGAREPESRNASASRPR